MTLATVLSPCPRWVLDALDARTPSKRSRAAGVPRSSRKRRAAHVSARPPDADAYRVRDACTWFEHCWADAALLPEPDWMLAATVCAACIDGRTVFHTMSSPWAKGGKRYEPMETDAKFDRACEVGPVRCETVACSWKGCSTCPHRGGVTTPVQLGRTRLLVIDSAEEKPMNDGRARGDSAGAPTPSSSLEMKATKDVAAPCVLDDKETDEAATRRLVARYGDRLRYCAELRRWYVWDATIWRPDRSLMVEEMARSAARAHVVDVASRGADGKRINRALAMEGRNHVMASIKGAASDRRIAILPENLDLDPNLLATPSGWVNLRTGQRLDPDPKRLVTQIAATDYDPTATCPRWDRFLSEIACDRADLVEFLRRWVGYCLTGLTTEQVLVVAYGSGANGKGTFWDTLRNHVFGPQYACEAPPKLLLYRDFDAHPSEFMELYRRRLVTASEVADDARWDEAKLKRLTGEDKIKGRYMRADFIEFDPTHKLVAYFNARPQVRDTTPSFWRRMRLVPFDASFTGATADNALRGTLASEAKGILAWAVRGAVDWYTRGLPESQTITEATATYRGDEDPVGSWLSERADDFVATAFQTARYLFDDFTRWCEDAGFDSFPWSKKAFGRQLRIHGAVEARKNSSRGWDLRRCGREATGSLPPELSPPSENVSPDSPNDNKPLQVGDGSDATHQVRPSCTRIAATMPEVASHASRVTDFEGVGDARVTNVIASNIVQVEAAARDRASEADDGAHRVGKWPCSQTRVETEYDRRQPRCNPAQSAPSFIDLEVER